MKLKNPTVIGFGISDNATFENACKYANGAIIGSAFVSSFKYDVKIKDSVSEFVNTMLTSV